MMYGMNRTTVYLPDDLRRRLSRAARATGCSEATLIREGIGVVVGRETARPHVPLFAGPDPTLAEHVDEALDGFGER